MTHTACPHGVRECPHEISPNRWQVCRSCFADEGEAARKFIARLEEYERAYGMSSIEFLSRWRGGDASLDKHEYFAWVGLCDMALRSGLLNLAEDDLGCRDLPQPHAHPELARAPS